jgi:hypothetical protein
MSRSFLWSMTALAATLGAADSGRATDQPRALERVRVAADGKSFVLAETGRPFVPWGFNYDHDADGKLIEDYWTTDWPRIEGDFREMAALGANVARIHLQVGRFLKGPDQANPEALDHLGRLLTLAEQTGVRLDLTGLGCYHKADVPAWYDALDESGRWAAQAVFWEAIAARCAGSPAVFCYDLMNEPVVSGARREAGDWLGPAFAGKHFVQFVTLDPAGRNRPEIARAWIRALVPAIRKHDPTRLVTVGLVDWSLDRPGLTSGFVPSVVAPELDFLCVHIYPERGKVDQAIATLEGFAAAGKPVVIEETFPLKASVAEFEQFLDRSRGKATGWVSFYWGTPPEELRSGRTIAEALLLGGLESWQALRPRFVPPDPATP